jgi:F-type H+-transporting ATPase subunit gamma
MKAVGNIERITKTMQLIASARFQKMQRRATDAQAYTRKIGEVVQELAAALGGDTELSHPLLSPPPQPAGKELLLVITSERGLCGAYNGNVLKTAGQHLREAGGLDAFDVEMVGKKGVAYCKFNQIPLATVHKQFGDEPHFEDVHALAQRYMDDFVAGRYDAVKVAYMSFVSMSKQTPVVSQLLPMQPPPTDETEVPSAIYDFSPDAQALLAEILPVTVKTSLYQWFNEAVVSEQLARMVAMKAATDAAGKLNKSLRRQFNRARQTAITTELSEIIGGAAALD